MNKVTDALPKVRIADIARESGVSLATVSLVLRDKPGIGQQTRERVLAKAQALGYSSQANQLPFPTTAVDTIGLLVKIRPDDLPETNSFYAPVLAGIEEVCRQRQINLHYANLPVDEQNVPSDFPRLLTEQQVNGLILIGMQFTRQFRSILADITAPCVFVDSYVLDTPVDSVVIDNAVGMYEATNFLIEQGHHKIALVGSSSDAFPSIQERRAGYEKAMHDQQLQPIFVDCALQEDAAIVAGKEFLRTNQATTALIGANDVVAIALLRVAQEVGFLVPDDLSIVGFDNIATTKYTTPPLTTMRVDKMGMGRLAMQLLLNRIDYPSSSCVKTVIRPSLIERNSVQRL